MHLRQYEIVQDVDKLKVDLQATFMKYKTIKQWAYIIHDKDDTRAHYHIYLNFGTGVDSKLVAQWFNLGYTDDNGVEHSGEQFIEKVKGRKSDILMYLTHENESQKFKHIYDRSEVHSNFNVDVEIEQAKIVGNFDKYSYAQQLLYIKTLPVDEQRPLYRKLEDLWKIHCKILCLNSDRHLDVVFICGKGGTGKTYYAKKMLESMELDFGISSASNDPFQDYMGQNAFILDDLRDTTFEKMEDLLKLLDNNTSSSARSRFSNKVFNGNVIVITSPVPIKYWYTEYRLNDHDGIIQLYRRIGTYIVVTDNEISVYEDGLKEDGNPAGVPVIYENEVRKLKENQSSKTDFVSVFDKISTRQPGYVQVSMDDEVPF